MARMTARYAGTCVVCGKRFAAGAEIDYDRATRETRHWDCQPFVAPEGAIHISRGEGYGGEPFTVGEVVPTPKWIHEEDPNAPAYLSVLHATQRYWREDGFSFGVGDESGYVYSAVCRAATEEESAPIRAAEARAAERSQAKRALDALTVRIENEGECPEQAHPAPEAREMFNTRNIYGGGSRYLIESGAVWYCRGNGGDGDDWRANNLGSEIATYLADPNGEIAAELERLAGILSTKAEA